jgi:deoxyribose-phosphate aldolase
MSEPVQNTGDMSLISREVRSILDRPLPGAERSVILRNILSLIDLTTLEGTDNDEKVVSLCRKGLSWAESGLPLPAAICIYPPFVKIAKRALGSSGVRVASVAGAFPSGQSPLRVRVEEVKYAVAEGADEIDMVISRGKFLAGDLDYVSGEILAIREVCGKAHLKVILETGELQTPENIRSASEIAIEAGADFIKTSTGKSAVSATPEAVWLMSHVIRDHFALSGKKTGIKPAGGISTPETAIGYYRIVREILGEEWLQPGLFRFGASRLADLILGEIL